jgi:hypothetical protein
MLQKELMTCDERPTFSKCRQKNCKANRIDSTNERRRKVESEIQSVVSEKRKKA